MKTLQIVFVAALMLGSGSSLLAGPSRVEQFSFGWFGTAGYYPIEYWVDVYDLGNSGIHNFEVRAYYESSGNWQTQETLSGNSAHRTAHGYGDALDDSTPGTIHFTNGTDLTHDYVEFYY